MKRITLILSDLEASKLADCVWLYFSEGPIGEVWTSEECQNLAHKIEDAIENATEYDGSET